MFLSRYFHFISNSSKFCTIGKMSSLPGGNWIFFFKVFYLFAKIIFFVCKNYIFYFTKTIIFFIFFFQIFVKTFYNCFLNFYLDKLKNFKLFLELGASCQNLNASSFCSSIFVLICFLHFRLFFLLCRLNCLV